MAKVPLIQSEPVSEFGDIALTSEFHDPAAMARDHSYVPGFSEMRRERDLQIAEVKAGTRDGRDVRQLPVNCRWARSQNKAGEPDSSKMFSHSRRGYRAVTKDDVGKNDWFKELPGGTSYAADGTIRNGDLTLMVCDRESAARNQKRKEIETNARLTGAVNTFAHNLQAANGRIPRGADPYVRMETTPKEK